MATVSLREKQIASIRGMLNLNESVKASSDGSVPKEPVWKILIYDRVGMDILTPLFTVQELRQNGITLHIPLHSAERIASGIPDVPSIYLTMPTEDNIDRISRDIQSSLYGNYYLNFLRPIPRSRIEDLATAVLTSPDNKCVSKVFDQYIDFVALEDDLFVLNCKQGIPDFFNLNRSNVTDVEMNEMLDGIVDSLFSVCVTHGQVPIIRTPTSNAAEIIGEKLDKKIRDNLRDTRSSLFQNNNDFGSRPLLLIYDRSMDLSTGLAHAWTYQALTHDILENNQNQVKFSEGESQKIFSVDTRRDTFWKTHKNSPFPTVAEAIQLELEEYRKREEEVKRLKASMGGGEEEEFDLSDNTAKLTSAINDLPALIQRKRILDAHTSIATGILASIKSRNLDTYYEVESKLRTESVPINNILLDGTNLEDRLRLYLIYYLCHHDNVSKSELEQFALSLAPTNEQQQSLLAAITYVSKSISYSKLSVPSSSASASAPSKQHMLSKLVNTGSNFLMEGVRNFVVKQKPLPLTRLASDLLEGRECPELRYFDPKQLQNSRWKPSSSHTSALVFVVGGGNYVEYQNLVDSDKKITYGATQLYNGEQFLQQLALLGKEL